MLMAKAGADVIKIEPPQGEPLRRRAPPGKSTTFPIAMLNGNKRAITLEPEARARPRPAVPHGREGRHPAGKFRARRDGPARRRLRGVAARSTRVSSMPRAPGYGLSGPDRDNAGDGSDDPGDGRADQRRPAFRMGRRSKPARRSSISSPASISMPRRSRRCSSASAPARGRMVEVAMQEAAYATLTSQLEAYWQTGKVPPRTGNASHGRVPINVYPTNDGYVAMNLAVEEHWHSLLKAMGREDLRDDTSASTRHAARVRQPRGNRRADRRLDADARQDGDLRDRQAAPHPAGAGARCRRGHARPAHARARLSRRYRARRDRPAHGAELAACAFTAPTRCARSRARSSASTTTRSTAAGSACRRPRSRR